MNKILLLSPCGDATGNRTTALRYASIFMRLNFEVILEDPSRMDESRLINLLETNNIVLVVVVHVTRSAVLLDSDVASSIPIIIVLGGTDANVDSQKDPILFKRRISRANAVVGFTQSLFETPPYDTFPSSISQHIIPQGFQFLSMNYPANDHGNGLIVKEVERDKVTATLDNVAGASSMDDKANVHDILVDIASPFFLLIAGIRPVKDVLYLRDAIMKLRYTLKQHQLDRKKAISLSTSSSPMNSSSSITDRDIPCLVIIGPILDNLYYSEILKEIEKSEGAIKFYPAITQSEVHQVALHSLAVLNSSISEGQSSALLEAMTLGVPVMVKDIVANKKLLASVHSILEEDSDINNDDGSQGTTHHKETSNISSLAEETTIQTEKTNVNNISSESLVKNSNVSIRDDVLQGESQWQFYPTGILFSSPTGFYEAALSVFYPQSKETSRTFDSNDFSDIFLYILYFISKLNASMCI